MSVQCTCCSMIPVPSAFTNASFAANLRIQQARFRSALGEGLLRLR